jgi:ATP-dependent helicase/nuclease subunit A
MKKRNITFIGAGAGSGKTHRVTEEIQSRLNSGKCRPGGLIATTFTIKAANELVERIRGTLYRAGQTSLAERLDEAMVGTVHSVCKQLLERFAFEAGISPSIEVLAEEDARLLFVQAVELASAFHDVTKIQTLEDRLSLHDTRTGAYSWKKTVHEITNQARSNYIAASQLASMAERSAGELLSRLPAASTADLDRQLLKELERAEKDLIASGDATDLTRKCIQLIQQSRRDLEGARLAWCEWLKLSKAAPAAKCKPLVANMAAVAGQFGSHPKFHSDLRDYIQMIFTLAANSLAQYQKSKEERGLVDFTDLEQRTLELIRGSDEVKSILQSELDLLVVDEFQDTSPIQLALFLHLAHCAKEVLWVGDVKQAIFGFRGTSPELTDAVIAQLRKEGGVAEPLGRSFRSVPDLVAVVNELFTRPFADSLQLSPKEVQLAAARESMKDAPAAVEFFSVSSGVRNKTKPNNLKALQAGNYEKTVALGVKTFLGNPPVIFDKESRTTRKARARDIAVLCRRNDDAAEMAEALMAQGFSVTLASAGLLQTPEVLLAMACFKRLLDPGDTLAAAEIVALEGKFAPEEWLENRLRYLSEAKEGDAYGVRWGLDGDLKNQTLIALESSRGCLETASPTELLDLALFVGNVFGTASSWGPTQSRANQRRSNLEALRGLAAKYEESCATNHRPATAAGFLFWCDDLAEAEADARATDEKADAIHVLTYHKSKGLEWPIVICCQLGEEVRPRIWDSVIVLKEDEGQPFSFEQPLANRRLSFWPWPFGQHKKDIQVADAIEASPFGQAALRAAESEELRLLYVGFTRARDLLIPVLEKEKPHPWIDFLRAGWFCPEEQCLTLPSGATVPCRTRDLTPPEVISEAEKDSEYIWFPSISSRTKRPPARLVPSMQEPLPGAKVAEVLELGGRIKVAERFDEAALGDALHAIFAAEFVHPGHPERHLTAARIIEGFGLSSVLKPEEALRAVDRFQKLVEEKFLPKQSLVETPFTYENGKGQVLNGVIDLAVETETGWFVFDHKSFPGKRADWEKKALSYSGQLECYRQALSAANMEASSFWIHFAVGGGLVRVDLP